LRAAQVTGSDFDAAIPRMAKNTNRDYPLSILVELQK
jgi:hypothetical protein